MMRSATMGMDADDGSLPAAMGMDADMMAACPAAAMQGMDADMMAACQQSYAGMDAT